MEKIYIWGLLALTVGVAVTANSVSAVWASKENKYKSIWFVYLLLVSPLVFVTFGLTANSIGLAIGGAVADSLLTVSTVLVGLFFFHEWKHTSRQQLLGLAVTITGIIFTQI